VIVAALAQMRPVLMMVVVALLGMTPAAYATGIGSDVQRPLATVLVGGLLSTLLLTLLASPSVYVLVVGKKHDNSRTQAEKPAAIITGVDIKRHERPESSLESEV
jgi:Cu/Ag efflux pump CusA